MRALAPAIVVIAFTFACTKEPAPNAVPLATSSSEPSAASATAPPNAASAAPPPSASSSAPFVPSSVSYGLPRPKGDGTCVADGVAGCTSPPCTKVVSQVPCPAIPTAKSTDEELGAAACNWSAGCERMGDEGCCVGCSNPFRVKLSRTCALQIVAKKDCKSVQATWDACAGK
ncbi:hypothetical protein BH09MYX1_BH09MYX1_30340 [soil metagenome]